MDFFLFLLVNAALFIRPGELMPSLAAVPIYNIVIVIALAVAAPAIIDHLTRNGLTGCPTTACVLGVFAFIVISHLARFDLWTARHSALEFAKIVAYFLLLMATVTTPKRLFTLLGSVVVFALIVNILAVLDYKGIMDFPTIQAIMENDFDELSGQTFTIPRMQGTGIFQDPNDLSLLIVSCILICAAGLFYKAWGGGRLALVAPIGFLGYALTLTQSRGGLLALIAGCGALFYARYGMGKAIALGGAGLPVLLAGFGGRQLAFGSALRSGTGHTRAELWSGGLQSIKQSPLFGAGYGLCSEAAGGHAHNSFVHTFVELGFFGGLLFLGLFTVAGFSLWQLLKLRKYILHEGLRHFVPFMIALLAGYMISMMSLSRSYIVPTYLMAGSAAVVERLTRAQLGLPPLTFTSRIFTRLCFGSIGFILFIYMYIKVLHRMG